MLNWTAIEDQLPIGTVMIYAQGECHIAVLVRDPRGTEPIFMGARTSDPLPWPSHWMRLPDPPAPAC